VSPVICWNGVAAWWQSIYWYQYTPTSRLLSDLKNGNGLPAPQNNPYDPQAMMGHGWIMEEYDLARIAFHELQQREKSGILPTAARQQMDDLAFSYLGGVAPRGPAPYLLEEELATRLAEGKLAPELRVRILQNAVALTLRADPTVVQWDAIPIHIGVTTRLPRAGGGQDGIFIVHLNYLSVRIDGQEVPWSSKPWRQPASTPIWGSPNSDVTRLISYWTPGRHRIDLDVRVYIRWNTDFRTHNNLETGTVVYTESRSLNTSFDELPPPLGIKLARFVKDPWHEGAHYLPTSRLRNAVPHDPTWICELAFTELMRRDGLGELPERDAEGLADQILAIQKDRSQQWNGAFGDFIESLQASKRLPKARWQKYGRQQLEFYLRGKSEITQGENWPVDLVTVARRGNSRVGAFDASQWKIDDMAFDGVPQFVKLNPLNGSDVYFVPHTGAEYAHQYYVDLHDAKPGKHTLWAKLTGYDLTWTDRPLQMEIPTEYDLGQVEVTVLPHDTPSVRPINAPGLEKQIRRSIAIDDLLQWNDGMLTGRIDVHHPPIDVAFHVWIEAGGKTWDVFDICSAKNLDSDAGGSQFTIRDAKDMPAPGLIFHFKADPSAARKSASVHDYWDGEFSIGPVAARH
jgi:hypothetical protein